MGKPRVGWIGTGVIGGACAKRLADAGYPLSVTTRTRAKAAPALEAGAIWKNSAAEVAAESDVVFSCVGYPTDVQEVFFGEQGVLSQWTKESHVADKIYVDMSTSSPELAIKIADAAKKHGFQALDAPVSGGDVGAQNGTLSIMIGGDEEPAQRIHPILAVLGTNIRRQGPSGAGQRTKLANQILISGSMIGVCEALLYAYKAGLDPENVLASVATGAAGSWSLSNYAPRILRGDYEPGFYVEHFVKDMKLALEDAHRLELALPGLSLVRDLYDALSKRGGARMGTQALILTLAELSGVDAFHQQSGGAAN
ncbi:MAG: NAD(P)-dependent oxidoreductase [Thermoguttaceae bacterium]|jgi:3-hydroxyisobutyrate dehydrogenase